MKIRSIVCATAPLLLTVALAPKPAQAQTIPSSYRFIDGGQEVSFLSGPMAVDAGTLQLGPRSGTFFGARYAIETVGPVFFEGLVTYLPTEREVIDPRRAADDRSIGETPAHLVMVDARIDFSLTGRRTWRRISPHLFAGVGLAVDLAGESELAQELLPEDVFDFGTAFTVSAGSGVRVPLTSNLMLRADAGMTLWNLGTPGGFDDPAKRPDTGTEMGSVAESEWVAAYGLALSLGWRF